MMDFLRLWLAALLLPEGSRIITTDYLDALELLPGQVAEVVDAYYEERAMSYKIMDVEATLSAIEYHQQDDVA